MAVVSRRIGAQSIENPQQLCTAPFASMALISEQAYQEFLALHDSVSIEAKAVRLFGPQRPKTLQPVDFKTETTTLWSFPQRGKWATHRASYRGNWAPQIARNLILRYSRPGDTVLDQMVGGGTTLVECRLTGRNGIGVDVNRDALILTMDRLNFTGTLVEPLEPVDIRLYHGDARNLNMIADDSIDMVATHPPYASIIRYTTSANGHVEGDLSKVRSIATFVEQMRIVAQECYRVLKPDHYCAVLVGDTRRNRHYTPIAFRVMQAFLAVGFILKENIIKAQWNTQTEGLWGRLSRDKNFLLIMHENLFVFRKPAPGEKARPYAESMDWW